jgi:hypothetical protein
MTQQYMSTRMKLLLATRQWNIQALYGIHQEDHIRRDHLERNVRQLDQSISEQERLDAGAPELPQ